MLGNTPRAAPPGFWSISPPAGHIQAEHLHASAAASASSLSRLRHMNMKRLNRLWSPTGVPTLDEEEEFGEVDDLLSV